MRVTPARARWHEQDMSREDIMRDGLDRYLDENGFSIEEYTAPTVTISIGPIPIRFPNSPARQRAIPLHDLHHVLTGYGTDLAGEAEIGMWELRAGCTTPFLWLINLMAVGLGLVIAPRRLWRAWRAAKGARSLYLDGQPAAAYLSRSIDEVRRAHGVPAEGVADPRARRLHGKAPRREPAPSNAA
jgi:hypothetical protein